MVVILFDCYVDNSLYIVKLLSIKKLSWEQVYRLYRCRMIANYLVFPKYNPTNQPTTMNNSTPQKIITGVFENLNGLAPLNQTCSEFKKASKYILVLHIQNANNFLFSNSFFKKYLV